MPLPPQPLSHEQRQQACALLALGATRRMAANFVHCRLLDLMAEMRQDPAFKQQVLQHELRPEIEVLRSLLVAARDPKQWRAAAWVLERLYPRRYAARKADVLRPANLQAALARLEKGNLGELFDPQRLRQRCRQRRRQKASPTKSEQASSEELEDREVGCRPDGDFFPPDQQISPVGPVQVPAGCVTFPG